MHTFSSILKTWVTGITDFFFPQSVEISAIEKMSPAHFLERASKAEESSDRRVQALFSYRDPLVRKSIWQVKYKGNTRIARILAHLLYDVLLDELAEAEIFDGIARPLLLPIPISRGRRHERGFNQSELLLDELKKIDTEKTFATDYTILVKNRETPHQTTLTSKKKRLENLAESFTVRKAEGVAGRSIFIIDDVTTTGATFTEAFRALRAAGIKNVHGIALAH